MFLHESFVEKEIQQSLKLRWSALLGTTTVCPHILSLACLNSAVSWSLSQHLSCLQVLSCWVSLCSPISPPKLYIIGGSRKDSRSFDIQSHNSVVNCGKQHAWMHPLRKKQHFFLSYARQQHIMSSSAECFRVPEEWQLLSLTEMEKRRHCPLFISQKRLQKSYTDFIKALKFLVKWIYVDNSRRNASNLV